MAAGALAASIAAIVLLSRGTDEPNPPPQEQAAVATSDAPAVAPPSPAQDNAEPVPTNPSNGAGVARAVEVTPSTPADNPAESPEPTATVASTEPPPNTPVAQSPPPGERPLTELISEVERSVVRIEGKTSDGTVTGTGFVHRDTGKIVTNYHVIEGLWEATCLFPDGRRVAVTRVNAADSARDFAVLTVDADLSSLGLDIAAELPPKGSRVIACGNPKGFSFTVSEGIVSAVRTADEIKQVIGFESAGTWVQTSAPISEGNSGGPLIANDGTVVGMNTWVLSTGQNLNFALSCVDLNEATRVASIENGKTLSQFTAQDRSSARRAARDARPEVLTAKQRREETAEMLPALANWIKRAEEAEEAVFALKRELEGAVRSGDEAAQESLDKQVRIAAKKCEKLLEEKVFREPLKPRSLRRGQVGTLSAGVVVVKVLDRSEGAVLANIGRNLGEKTLVCLRGIDLQGIREGRPYTVSSVDNYFVAGESSFVDEEGRSTTMYDLVNLGTHETFLRRLIEPEALTIR